MATPTKSNAGRVIKFAKEKTEKQLLLIIKRLAFGIFRDILLLSPVDTGRYRNSWTLQVGSPNLQTAPEGSQTSFPIMPSIEFKLGDDIFIANAVVYAQVLEEGHSNQAPLGVARVSVQANLDKINMLFAA